MKIKSLNVGSITQMADRIENKNIVFNSTVSEKEFFDYFSKEKGNIESSFVKLQSESNEEKEEAVGYLKGLAKFCSEHKGAIKMAAMGLTAVLPTVGIPIPHAIVEKLEKLLDDE